MRRKMNQAAAASVGVIGVIGIILIGLVGGLFVTYKMMDSLHLGTLESDNCTLNTKTNTFINTTQVPAAAPTYMQKKANGAYNGTAPITVGAIVWPIWNTTFAAQKPYQCIYVNYSALKDGLNGAVRNDTKYLQVNYTARGGEVRAIIAPIFIMIGVVAIILVVGSMMSEVNSLDGGGRPGKLGKLHIGKGKNKGGNKRDGGF